MQHVCLSQVHWFFSHLLLETTFCDFNLISWISFQLSHITQHLFKGQTTLDMGHYFLSDKKHNNVMGFILILFYLHSCMYISIPFLGSTSSLGAHVEFLQAPTWSNFQRYIPWPYRLCCFTLQVSLFFSFFDPIKTYLLERPEFIR